MKYLTQILPHLQQLQRHLAWLPPVLARLVTGWIFLWSGWGKLHNLQDVTDFFTSLGIPGAAIQAPFIASLEFAGGLFLLAGFGTRFFSFMLSSTMVVAIVTAKREDIESLGDLFETSEFIYIVLFVYLIVQGAGTISGDFLLTKRLARTTQE